MVKPQRNKSEPGLLGKGQRYWSIMLVGEHGRVIPFRRFKEIAITVIALACLSLVALAVIAYLYAQQAETIGGLQREVDALRRQTAQLKDEKDVLHAKLVIYDMQKAPEAAQKTKPKEIAQGAQKPAPTPVGPTPVPPEAQPVTAATPPPQATSSAPATPTSTPSVNWALDLQQFDAQYDERRELIKLTVRVSNKTATKKTFSGRMILVLKQSGSSPKGWVSLPSVPLAEGKPTGKNGQAFTVQNYRTLDFKLYKQRPPFDYDTATVFVFLSNGELLLSRDFSLKIEVPPTATPAPEVEAPPTPTTTPDMTTPAPAVTPSSPIVPGAGSATGDSGGSILPGSGSGPGSTAAPSQGQPPATATPAVSVPAVSPVLVPEKSLEAEPKR